MTTDRLSCWFASMYTGAIPLRQRRIRSALATVLGLSYLNIQVVRAAEVTVIVDRVLSAVEAYDLCSIDAVMRTLQTSSKHPVDMSARPRRVGIRRGTSRVRLFGDSYFSRSNGSFGTLQYEHVLLNTGEVLDCTSRAANDSGQSNPRVLVMFWSERLAGKQRIHSGNLSNRLGYTSVLLWDVGKTPFRSYFADNASIREHIEENDVYRIEAISDFGQAIMTVSADSGWLPIRLEIHKTAESLTSEGPLSSFYKSEGDENVPTITSIVWLIESGDFRRTSNGGLAPHKLTVSSKEEYENRTPFTSTRSIEIERLRFGEPQNESDFDRKISIPIGHHITVVDAEHLQFEWNGERPVAVSPSVSRSITNTLVESGGGNRILLILMNIALVLILAFLLWRKRATT